VLLSWPRPSAGSGVAGRGGCRGSALGRLAFAAVSAVVVVPYMRPAVATAIVVIGPPWDTALNALVVFDM
jgi:hypothetical protein